MKGKTLLLIVTLSFFKLNAFAQTYQTTLGKGTDTKLEVYEYYHHTGEEKWVVARAIYLSKELLIKTQ